MVLTKENLNKKTQANESALYLALNHFSTDPIAIKAQEEIANFLVSNGIIYEHFVCQFF